MWPWRQSGLFVSPKSVLNISAMGYAYEDAPAAKGERRLPTRMRHRYGRGMRVGILTGGGDCPGLNAVIRAVVKVGVRRFGHEHVGILHGWRGLLEQQAVPLGVRDVSGILDRGGTILKSSRTNPCAPRSHRTGHITIRQTLSQRPSSQTRHHHRDGHRRSQPACKDRPLQRRPPSRPRGQLYHRTKINKQRRARQHADKCRHRILTPTDPSQTECIIQNVERKKCQLLRND